MKNLFVALLAGLALAGCRGTAEPGVARFDRFTYAGDDVYYREHPLTDSSQYYNPILPGWYSDPSVCTNGRGDYYLVTSTFAAYPGVPVFHSRDLLNWRHVGNVLTRPEQCARFAEQKTSEAIFAPDISYNPADSLYYMVTTNVGAGNFVVTARDPAGEWSDPVMLPEVQGIDPSLFFDDDGRAYIVNNDDAPDGRPEYDGHRTIRLVEYDTRAQRCTGERTIIVDKGSRPEERPIWCEGPHIYKRDGVYYLMTAEGGTADGHSEVIYRADDVRGPYVAWEGNPILTQRDLPAGRADAVACAGHADLFRGPDGRWWAVFLATRPIGDGYENLGRETFMLPVEWTADGWPVILRAGESVPLTGSVPGARRGPAVTYGNFTLTDDFDGAAPADWWLSMRGDASGYYDLTGRPGWLSMRCAPVATDSVAVLPFLGRRVQHHRYTASTRLDFEPQYDTEMAGLMVYKDETHQYLLARTSDGLRALRVGTGGCEVLASAPVSVSVVDLRIVSDGESLSMDYSTDGGEQWQTLASGLPARYTSTAGAWGFTGTLVGPFATGR